LILEEDDTVVDGEKESLAAAEEHIALVGQYNNQCHAVCKAPFNFTTLFGSRSASNNTAP